MAPVASADTTALPTLTKDEVLRYSRHLILPEVGMEGQQRLKAAKVLCIGAGGLGSPLALYLAAAGVGTLGIVDFDIVDVTNLQRQILHNTDDVGHRKLDSAATKLKALNPHLNLLTYETKLTSENALELFAQFDMVVDGTDNFPTRYLVNDACVLLKKPNVYGSIFRFEGQASVFAPHLGGPCYRCLFPEPPPPGSVPNCAQAGVLGVLPGIIGTIQASEAIKLILGVGEPLIGRLLYFDALKMKFREFNLRQDPQCPVCGDSPSITKPIDYEQFCGISTSVIPTVSVRELKQKLDARENFQLVDVREPFEHEIASIDGARLIPLGELPDRLDELNRETLTIVHCHSGQRSAQAVRLMREAGFANVFNLEGGIARWSDEVDSDVPQY